MVVSFDTGPTWANWAAQFAAFKKRYPDVEIVYNDLGSAATVVALEKARNRPQADTAYYFAASAVDAVKKGVVAPFKPVNFDKLPAVFREPEGRWFTIHSLTVAFVVNTKLVKNVPAVLGRPAQARVQELDRLPRPALDRRGPGADVRRELRQRRRHEQRPAGPRLPRQAAPVRQRAARARHDALRAVREGRDPDLDQLRERRAQGEVDRRPRRRGGGGDPEGRPRPLRRTASAWWRRGRTRTPASCGSTSS